MRSRCRPERRRPRQAVSCERLEHRQLLAVLPTAQWRADDLNQSHADGEVVAEWVDTVGSLSAAASGSPRLVHDALDGHSVVRFNRVDGVDTLLVSANDNPLAGATDFALVVVFATESQLLNGGQSLWFLNTGLVDATSFFGTTAVWGLAISRDGRLGGGLGGPAQTVYSSTGGLNDGAPHVAVYAKRGNQLELYVDQGPVDILAGASDSPRIASDVIFGAIAGGSFGYTGDLAEIRFYDQVLSPTEIQDVIDELTNRYRHVPPQAVGDTYSVDEDSVLQIDAPAGVLANDVNVENELLTAQLVEAPRHGTLQLQADGGFTYEPLQDFNGEDTFRYLSNNTADSEPVTVEIEVRPVYDPPRVVPDQYVAAANQRLIVEAERGLLANDSHLDGLPLSVEVVLSPQQGDLQWRADGSFDYLPRDDFVGHDQFVYQAQDGVTTTSTVMVTLEVVDDTVRISEFQASNGDTLRDRDGDSPDWIELENPISQPMDVSGWYLTDDRSDLNKWRFPQQSIVPAEGRLVIFASGKDRREPEELHTNFSLDADGEFLALLMPDGTGVSQFAPRFPSQRTDISYGVSFQTEESRLASSDAMARYLVPRTEGDLPADWEQPAFDDGSWQTGSLALGFDLDDTTSPDDLSGLQLWLQADDIANGPEPANGAPVMLWRDRSGGGHDAATVTDFIPRFSHPIKQELTVAEGDGERTIPVVRFSGSADELMRADDIFFGPDTIDESAEDEQFGELTILTVYQTSVRRQQNRPVGFGTAEADSRGGQNGGNYGLSNDPSIRTDNGHIGGHSQPAPTSLFIRSSVMQGGDDGSIREFFDGEQVLNSSANFSVRSDNFYLGDPRFPFGDDVDLAEVIVYDRPLSDVERQSVEQYLMRKYFAEDLPPESTSLYASLIGSDLIDSMHEQNASVFVRSQFDAPARERFEALSLRVRYDDGFVAYLNGVEVARRNAPSAVSWNATATAPRPDAQAVMWEEIVLDEQLPLLRAENNVLALQGLNEDASEGDFLLVVELVGRTEPESQLQFFDRPTPGASNGEGFDGLVGATLHSVARGFFDAPIEVAITSPLTDAVIRYTTDGSLPTATHGDIYSEPIRLATQTTLRSAAFREGWLTTDVNTHSYIFLNDVVRQTGDGLPLLWGSRTADYEVDPNVVQDPLYSDSIRDDLRSIPTLSIVMNPHELFGSGGIYANSEQRGVQWERAASLEYILPDGTTGFQEDAGVRIFGFSSRLPFVTWKHSLRLLFKREYGEPNLAYPLFADSEATEFDDIVLRAKNAKSWNDRRDGEWNDHAQYIRDAWARDTMRDMGQPTSHATYVHLYLNGLYWGLYMPVERLDASFMARYFGGEQEDYDALNTRTGTLEVVDGNRDAWDELIRLAKGDVSKPEGLAAIEQYLNIENMIDYFNVYFYAGARDWVGTNGNNQRVARKREPEAQFIAVPWDFENSFWEATDNNTSVITTEDTLALVHARLMSNPEYRLRFADRVQQHFFNDGALTPDQVTARWMARATEIDRAIVGESARWGDARVEPPRTRDVEWIAEQNRLLTEYFPQRSDILVSQYIAMGLFPDLPAPTLVQHGGHVPQDFPLTMAAAAGTIYYTLDGTDPRQPGGAIAPTAIVYDGVVQLQHDTLVTARALRGDVWSARTAASFVVGVPATSANLRISELHFHPSDPTAVEVLAGHQSAGQFEFVELVNIGSETVDLTDVRWLQSQVGDREEGIAFDFAKSQIQRLEPGRRVLVVSDVAAFEDRYGGGLPVAGAWTGTLSNNREQLTLAWNETESQQFSYDDDWHPLTDGRGRSLELINAHHSDLASWGQAGSWQPSTKDGGTPGAGRLRGDLTADDRVDAADIDVLAAAVRNGRQDRVFDLTGERQVDERDRVALVAEVLQTVPGDANLDGVVSQQDGQALLRHLGTTGGWANGDFDGDGMLTASGDGALLLAGLVGDRANPRILQAAVEMPLPRVAAMREQVEEPSSSDEGRRLSQSYSLPQHSPMLHPPDAAVHAASQSRGHLVRHGPGWDHVWDAAVTEMADGLGGLSGVLRPWW